MKKLSVILSVLLCLSAMVTGVSAKSTGEILTGDDALAIYEKCVNKMGKAEYLEVREFWTLTNSLFTPPEITRTVTDYKFAAPQDGRLQIEKEEWNARGEKTVHRFFYGDYEYDRMVQKKYWSIAPETMLEQIYVLTVSLYGSKDDITNIKAEKLENGYRLSYRINCEIHDTEACTLMINDDFTLESIIHAFTYTEGYYSTESDNKGVYTYEILSINRPFKIKFPADLSSYELF